MGCAWPPEKQYAVRTPLMRGFKKNGKPVYNCKAVQEAIDLVFGKGVFSTVLERNQGIIPNLVAGKLSEMLNSKSRKEFEENKLGLRNLLEDLKSARKAHIS